MGEKRGMKALELWCKRVTDGYPGVKVENMTTSWRDGLAFCALIHHFRPDLIDFTNLDKNDIYGNNELAFRTAERHLGIPALLDAEDMAEYEVPDRLSILTYLSQFYQAFASQASSPVKRTTDSPDRQHVLSSAVPTPPSKEVGVRRREPCRACGLPVFLAQRLIVSSHLYHRTCFRCARCSAQLSLANYYETQEGVFCCEICPDEEARKKMAEEEIGDKGGGTICDTKSVVNIVNEDKPSLEKDIQHSTALEKTESLVSTRNASLVGLRRMMFENISHTDDEKLPKFRKLSYGKSFQESQKMCDIKSDFIIKDSSENDSASVKVSEANLVTDKNKIDDNSFLKESNLDRRRYSDISFIDKESDQDESVNKEYDDTVEKKAFVSDKSFVFEERENSVDKEEKLDVDIPVIVQDTEVIVPISVEETNDLDEQEESNKSIDNKNSLILDSQYTGNNEFIDNKVDNNESVLIEAKNNAIEISEGIVEAKNDTVCKLVVDATNDVVCDIFIEEETKLREPLDTEVNVNTPIPPARSKSKDKTSTLSPKGSITKPSSPDYPEDLNPFGEDNDEVQNMSTNPFGSSEDEDEAHISVEIPTPQQRKLLPAPKFSLNPFGSDSDEELSDENISSRPVPMPRSLRTPEPSPLPRSKMRASRGSTGSASSLASRKKKHAPLPPPLQSPRTRKARQAPRPPPVPRTVSPSQPPPLPTSSPPSTPPSSLQYIPSTPPSLEKNNKDFMNRQRQNSETSSISSYVPNKSTYGQWKRKKGPAPARPIPQRRFVKPMPIKDIRQELDDIEIKQQELERQGVKLEQTIRDKFEQDTSLTPYVEEMVLQLFELVNEKNELFRRQAELMYLRRQHNLEEEHAELEYQIRCLMMCPDHNKTDSDKAREEELIHRLVEVVERRDEIIQCLEMDRLREAEEDRSVNTQLGIFSAAMGSELDLRTKSDKKEKKIKKEKKVQRKGTLDVDKDVDEMDKERKKHKKKWFTLHHKT